MAQQLTEPVRCWNQLNSSSKGPNDLFCLLWAPACRYIETEKTLLRVSLCSLGWHGAHYVEQAGDPPVFHVLGLKAYSITPGPWFKKKNNNTTDLYIIETQLFPQREENNTLDMLVAYRDSVSRPLQTSKLPIPLQHPTNTSSSS